MKMAKRLAMSLAAVVLSFSLVQGVAWADGSSAYEQLASSYPEDVRNMLDANISEAQLESFVDELISSLQADASVTDATFDTALITKSYSIASSQGILDEMISVMDDEEKMMLAQLKVPASLSAIRTVVKGEWQGATGASGGAVGAPGAPAGETGQAPDWLQVETEADTLTAQINFDLEKLQAAWIANGGKFPRGIEVEVSNAPVELHLDKELVNQGTERGETLRVKLQGVGEVAVPFSKLPQVADGLVLHVQPSVLTNESQAALAQANLQRIGSAIAMWAIRTDASVPADVFLQGKSYLETSILLPADQVIDGQTLSAYRVSTGGKLTAVPVTLSTANGVTSAVIHHMGTGEFVIAKRLPTNPFADIKQHWGKSNIELLANKGILTGYGDGSFRPNQTVTRAEIVTMLTRALGVSGYEAQTSKSFTDVEASDWYSQVIREAVGVGLVNGDPKGTFRPNDKITRQEAAVLFSNGLQLLADRVGQVDAPQKSLPFTDAATLPKWAQGAVSEAYGHGLISGYANGTFLGERQITRAEVASMLTKLLEQGHLIVSES
ncbi:MAG TPA: S-layer homology domain-containing protein [Bacilli bacterium]|nr:S-layer homology domain-containing protein [Bacilli bacterium]